MTDYVPIETPVSPKLWLDEFLGQIFNYTQDNPDAIFEIPEGFDVKLIEPSFEQKSKIDFLVKTCYENYPIGNIMKKELKLGDRVKTIANGDGELVGWESKYGKTYALIKLDSGEKGSGPNGEWRTAAFSRMDIDLEKFYGKEPKGNYPKVLGPGSKFGVGTLRDKDASGWAFVPSPHSGVADGYYPSKESAKLLRDGKCTWCIDWTTVPVEGTYERKAAPSVPVIETSATICAHCKNPFEHSDKTRLTCSANCESFRLKTEMTKLSEDKTKKLAERDKMYRSLDGGANMYVKEVLVDPDPFRLDQRIAKAQHFKDFGRKVKPKYPNTQDYSSWKKV